MAAGFSGTVEHNPTETRDPIAADLICPLSELFASRECQYSLERRLEIVSTTYDQIVALFV